jgi:hypothetical protein
MSIINKLLTKLVDSDSEQSFAFKFRKKRAEKIILLINECYQKYGKVNIIDIGGTMTYWHIISVNFLKEKKVHVLIVNLPLSSPLPESDEIFTYKIGDGCNLADIGDKSFHIAHSNSVIEHVGNWENKIKFSTEIQRVGEKYYLQTPNYWFPFEPHFMFPFFQWLPKFVRIKFIQHFNLGWFRKSKDYNNAKAIDESCSLLTKKELLDLFPNSSLYKEKVACLTKSFIVTG